MPIYCYTTDEGRCFEREFRMGAAPATISVADESGAVAIASRDYAAEHGAGHTPKDLWPLRCQAGGVHAHEVKRHRANVKRFGLNVTVNNDGSVNIPSQREYRRYCRAFGLHHYSDYMS